MLNEFPIVFWEKRKAALSFYRAFKKMLIFQPENRIN